MAIIKYSDDEIVKGIIGHDPYVYEYLDRLYHDKVLQYVRRNSGTKEEGEEHYQDVIFEIYLIIDQGRYNKKSMRSFVQYFWLIAKNRWIDKLRKRKGVYTSELSEKLIQTIANSKEEEVAEALYTKLVLLINKYLRQMTFEEQEYIRLYYYASKSVQFIADYFGTSYNYARIKLYRIRDKLRKLVKEDPEYQSLPNLITI